MSSAYADIYTCKDADGNTVYTDSPDGCNNAEEVKVDTLPTLIPTKPLATNPRNSTNNNNIEEKNSYTALTITSPANDSSVRDNQGNVTINFQVSPNLKTRNGHEFVVTLDGNQVYSGTSTITALKNVDRGTHTISVKVVAADGSTQISAAPVKFTLQRYSALQGNTPSQNNPSDGGGGDGSDGGGDNSGINQNGFTFPGNNTQLPTRPPPPPSNPSN